MGRKKDYGLFPLIFILCSLLSPNDGVASPDPASHLGPGPQPNLPNPRIVQGPQDKFFKRNEPETLNCNAEGDPEPTITWYQNGEMIVLENPDDKFYHRMFLNDGHQLFFWRVIHTKTNRPDVGTYFCKATNVHGTAYSRNATVRIAVIRDDFRQEPVNTTRSVGSTVVLHCKPPRGEPDVEVFWLKNDKDVILDERIQVDADGDLTISMVTKHDAGQYVCLGRNTAGEKRSSPAQLTVLDVPEITEYPEDITADEGETVEFHCSVDDIDPHVRWGWKKEGGTIDQQRWRMLPDHTLRIENVQAIDEGVYVCTAENSVGSVEAVAHLRVEYTPSFLVRPRDQIVASGRTVTLQCAAMGNPKPTIFWKTKSQESLLFAGKESGRFSVTDDGTLRLERVEKLDEGEYTCQALNSKGEAQVTATITVRENDLRPPPVIRFGPQNQTLPEDGVALLRCLATGSPLPAVLWFRNDRPLQMSDARFTLLDSGTLQISSLKLSDTGRYTCRAVSETGETTLEAVLNVEGMPLNPSKPIRPPPDLTMFPGAPTKPLVSDVTDTSAKLSWQLLRNTGASPVDSFQVEYFAYGVSQTWIVAADMYVREEGVINGLVPNTTYVFLVRAKNNHGLGGPSQLSDLIRTLPSGADRVPGSKSYPRIDASQKELENRLKMVVVQLKTGEAINSSAIKIYWEVPDDLGVVDGFSVRYKHIIDMRYQQYGPEQTRKVPYRPLFYTIGELASYEYYEICVMATSGSSVSDCSNRLKVLTGESVPSGPPEQIAIHRESDNSLLLQWSPPKKEQRKGKITSYQIRCLSKDESHNCSRVTNGSTFSLFINNLVAGANYRIQVAAATEQGIGKWSDTFDFGPEEADITKQPWFIGMVIGSVSGTLWLVFCILTVWLCRKRQQKKLKEPWFTGAQERNGSVVRKGYGVSDSNYENSNDSGLPPEFSSLLQQSQSDQGDSKGYNMARDGNLPEMKTFSQKQPGGPVTPYATTALLQAQNARKKSSDQMFHPGVQGYPQHSGGSGDSNTDRSNTTDENGFLIKQQKKGPGHPSMQPNQAAVNWSDVFLPPPPEHPPGMTEYQGEDQLYSEIPEDNGMTPGSVCSCPMSHSHVPGTGKPVYSDSRCNRCHSLRNFSNMPYSQKQILQHIQATRQQQPYPPNISRTVGSQQHSDSSSGTPVYLYGYSQPWDCAHPSLRGTLEYDYAQVPMDDAYNYTQPVQDGSIEQSNTLNRGSHRNPPKMLYGVPPGYCEGSEHSHPLRGPFRDSSHIPAGGPPGNYCEGPCRGQVETLNKFNRKMSDGGTQLPYLEGYKIESPASSSASEYKMVGDSHSESGGGSGNSGDRKRVLKSRPAEDMKQFQTPDTQYRPQVIHSRPDGPHPGHSLVAEGYTRNADSPISEDPDYADESENGGDTEHNNERDSMVANWESTEDCSSIHSSSYSSEDGEQFLNEEDFASAVAKAAVMSGLTVVGTTVSDPSPKPAKKSRNHHRQARAPSPSYSTDSNYGTADMIRKPYPKSQRRKQMAEQGRDTKGDNSRENQSQTKTGEVPSNTKPNFSSSPASPKLPPFPQEPVFAPEGTTSQEVRNPASPMMKFGEDIPVV